MIKTLTDSINQVIDDEKNVYLYSGQKLFEGASKGKELSQGEFGRLTQGSTLSNTINGFDEGIASIIGIKNDITKVFSNLTFYFYTSTGFFRFFPIAFILILAFTTVIAFGTQFVSCFRAQNKCHAMSCLTKCSVTILGLLAMGLTAILLLFVLINFSIGGLCDFAYQGTLENGDIGDVASTIPTSLVTLLSTECLKQGGEGKKPEEYISFADSSMVGKLEIIGQFLNGYSTYNNFLKTKEEQESFENAIRTTEKQWDLYKTGIIYNYENVEGTLTKLNTNVSSCQEQWVLNSQNCTSIQTGNLCRSVSTTDLFEKNRECIASKQEAQDSFDQMKNYLQGQGILMNKMILDLTGGQETSPLSKVWTHARANGSSRKCRASTKKSTLIWKQ